MAEAEKVVNSVLADQPSMSFKRLAISGGCGALAGGLAWGTFCYVLFGQLLMSPADDWVYECRWWIFPGIGVSSAIAGGLAASALAEERSEPRGIVACRLFAAAAIGAMVGAVFGFMFGLIPIGLPKPSGSGDMSPMFIYFGRLVFVYPAAGAILCAELGVSLVAALVYLREASDSC